MHVHIHTNIFEGELTLNVEALPAFENYFLEEGETFIYTITLDICMFD
jgi:hypothetical protein